MIKDYKNIFAKVNYRLARFNISGSSPLYLFSRIIETYLKYNFIILYDEMEQKIPLFKDRMMQKLPALHFDDLHIDWENLVGLLKDVINLIKDNSVDYKNRLEDFSSELGNSEYVHALMKRWFSGGEDANLDMPLAAILHASLYPVLASHSVVLQPHIPQEKWHQRFCPICGGKPDLSYLDKETGKRYLVCSRCDAEWAFLRLECPFCGNEDPNSLSYLMSQDEVYRLYLCDMCKRFIKCVDMRKTKEEVLLPLERILTLSLDKQAREMGYLTI